MLGGVLVPNATADQDNKAFWFSVNAPVEVPGVVLGPGQYQLKLQGEGSTIAGIWNSDGSRFYGFFNTMPVARSHRGAFKVVLTGSGKHNPERIEEWFYPGRRTGNEFLYPSKSNMQLVNATTNTQR